MVNTNTVLSSIAFSQTVDWNIKQFFNSTSIKSPFELKKIGTAITRRKDKMLVEDDKQYKRITIKTNCGGVVVRDEVLGREIRTKNQYYVRAGQLAVSKIDARNGAFGIVPPEADGAIITGNFWVYDVDPQIANIEYLILLLSAEVFVQAWQDCSNGSGNRLYLQEDKFLNYKVPMPSVSKQEQVINKYETLKPFIENDLGITSISKIELRFEFKNYDNANELLKTFIDKINPEHNVEKTYTLEELKDKIILETHLDELNNEVVFDAEIEDLDIFRYFTQAYMPKNIKIIKDIIIEINDGITVEQLSEGEKKLILVKTVLEILSDEKTLVLMDEPDAHLHEIRKKSLYSMMGEYPHRQIVIATHSPTFIDIAEQSQIKLLKVSDSGRAMLYEEEKLDAIRSLTGSRINAFLEKPILYCEGTRTSADYILYFLLFPEYKVIPAGGHDEVIHLTKTYNRTFGDTTHYAIGIIDRDYKSEAQLSALRNEKIYPLKVVEIENVLVDLALLEAAKTEFCSEEDCLEKAKQTLFNDCAKNKAYQAAKYTSNSIANHIKSNISPEDGSIEKIKQRIRDVCDIAKVDALYNERLQCLDKYLGEKSFEELVAIYDFNHNINRFLSDIVNDYQSRILKLIERRTDLQEFLKSKYYSEIE